MFIHSIAELMKLRGYLLFDTVPPSPPGFSDEFDFFLVLGPLFGFFELQGFALFFLVSRTAKSGC